MHEHMYKHTDIATFHATLGSLHVHDKHSAIFVFAVYASNASGEVLPK